MWNRQDLSNDDEALCIDRFANKNNFSAALHDGGIAGVAQDGDDQNNDDGNTYKDPDKPPVISLDPAADWSKIAGVPRPEHPVEIPGVTFPENPVELPGVAPPENEVDDDIITPLLPSDYDTSTQHRQMVVHPEDMPPMVRNVYNIQLQKQTDYTKKNIDRYMSFEQVGNDLNKCSLSFLHHEVMEHSEETIYYTTVIEYAFTQYSLNRGLK